MSTNRDKRDSDARPCNATMSCLRFGQFFPVSDLTGSPYCLLQDCGRMQYLSHGASNNPLHSSGVGHIERILRVEKVTLKASEVRRLSPDEKSLAQCGRAS